jgi:hypothetical protein
MHKTPARLGLALIVIAAATGAYAQSQAATDGIILLPTEVVVYQQSVGANEPVPEWTKAANENLTEAARRMLQKDARFRLLDLPELDEATRATLREHVELFKVIANELGFTVKMGGKPFQKNRDYPDYRVGDGLRFLRTMTGARYAMVLAGAEIRQTGGSVFFSLLVAGLTGAYVGGGGTYLYAGIVDLESGQVRWFNSVLGVSVFGMGGKGATNETGANKSLETMFATYPASPGLKFEAVPLEAEAPVAAPATPEPAPAK